MLFRSLALARAGTPNRIQRKSEPPGPRRQKNVVLYKSTWINPKPEVPVARLDWELKKSNTRPFIVAITADPVED